MQLKLLDQKHDCFDGALYCKYNALYEGGKTFHKNVSLFLPKNPMESGMNYEMRKKEAKYSPYVNSIINQFASHLFSSPFVVRSDPENLDPFYAEFKEDADLLGTDLSAFIQHLFITALINGRAWLYAELPGNDNKPPENLLEYQERNLGRVWLNDIEPSHVFDWEVDEFGQFLWVITHKIEKQRKNPKVDKKVIIETWKLYDQVNVETFQISYEPGKRPNADQIIPSQGSNPHGFPQVPILCLELPPGLWLMNRLADAQIEHFQNNCSLGWAMRRACSPTMVWKSQDDSEAISTPLGIKIGKEDDVKWIAPPSEAFDQIAKRIASFKDEIHRLALQMALAVDNSPGTLKRSGESKAKDAEATEIILYSYALIVKEFVEKLFQLISNARNEKIIFSIEGMDSFQIDDSESIINSANLAKNLNIQSETFNKELGYKVACALLPSLSQDIKDQIRKEINESIIDNKNVVQDQKLEQDQKKPDNISDDEMNVSKQEK